MTNTLARGQTALQVGDAAPDFTLPGKEGQSVSLRDYRGKQNLVLYFYPKDFSPGCTQEACAFRDSYEAFRDAGAEVIGVSMDGTESHEGFAQKHRLPFVLLTDDGGRLAKAYGVRQFMGIFRGRVTFVIDKQGVIRHIFESNTNMTRHVDEALNELKAIG